jgi:hypothetical protein
VEKFVAQKNGESNEREHFTQQGWTLTKTDPPDAKLVSFDPSLLQGREDELRQQIASTTANGADAKNLGRIAREARDEHTRVVAVEALGRIRSDEAQEELTGLLKALPEGSPARREVAPLLHPADLSSPRAAALAQLLDASDVNPLERKQIAFTLSLVGLRDRSSLPAAVLEKLSPDARALLDSTTSLAQMQH